jgi:predicted transcriptional regulator
MINQIESGRCKPSYDTAKRIFEVLSSQEGKTSLKAGDICSHEVITVQKDEKLEVAIDKMIKNSISQIPVIDTSKIVGLVSEDILIPLVRFSKCVLVSKKGEVTGIITISDTLKMAE